LRAEKSSVSSTLTSRLFAIPVTFIWLAGAVRRNAARCLRKRLWIIQAAGERRCIGTNAGGS
jgi:hypothetical protein